MGADMKQKAKQVFEKGYQFSQSAKKYKEKYDKYKELYELGKNLIDPDTRRATAFKEALNLLLKAAGRVLEADLTAHPYFVLNQPAMEALWEAITASDTIDNARKLLSDAEKNLNKLDAKAEAFCDEYNKQRSTLRSSIASKLRSGNSMGWNWTEYLRELNRDGFRSSTLGEAEDEISSVLGTVPTLLQDVRPLVNTALDTAPKVLEAYAALAAAGADIILAEKTYQEKIDKLTKSEKTISHTMGLLEKKRRMEEQVMDAIHNKPGAGKSMQQRVNSTLEDATRCAGAWVDFTDTLLSEDVLLIGSSGGARLPWNMPLPPASVGR